MPSIHVNPDELRHLSRQLELKAQDMLDVDFKLRQAGSKLDMAWRGGSAGDFLQDLAVLQQRLRGSIQEVYIMAQKLNREADRWEESDQTWMHEIRKVLGNMFKAGGK